jgi:hypothetical protein
VVTGCNRQITNVVQTGLARVSLKPVPPQFIDNPVIGFKCPLPTSTDQPSNTPSEPQIQHGRWDSMMAVMV